MGGGHPGAAVNTFTAYTGAAFAGTGYVARATDNTIQGLTAFKLAIARLRSGDVRVRGHRVRRWSRRR